MCSRIRLVDTLTVMATTGFDGGSSSLSRSIASEEDLEAAGLEVHLEGPGRLEIWKAPRGFFSRSLVMRKMAVWSEEHKRYVVRSLCAETLHCIGRVIDWPRCPEEVAPWLQACDFLLIDLQIHELAFAISCAVNGWLEKSVSLLCDCASFEALAHSRRMKSYNALVQISSVVRDNFMSDEPYAYGSPVRSLEEERSFLASKSSVHLLLNSLRCEEVAESGRPITDILEILCKVCEPYAKEANDIFSDQHAFRSSPLPLHGCIESVSKALLSLTNTAKGCLHLLGNVRSLRAAYGTVVTRHFVHRCFCGLYLAESLEEEEFCAVPPETVRDLQDLYREGILNLSCFIPVRDKLCYLLPGLLGSQEVSQVLSSATSIFERACSLVPWLSRILTGPLKLHLTGSFLCWCRTVQEPTCRPEPGDLDLFCERLEDLEQAAAQVSESLTAFAKKYWPDAEVSVARPNAYRHVLKVVAEKDSWRLDSVPSYMLSCDVYVNSLKKVSQYHLPQVRGSLRLEKGKPELFLTASAAISWITMLNIDYNAFRGAKTPLDIVARRWLWGFNLCVSERERRLMCEFLMKRFPSKYLERFEMQRPQRLSAHGGCVFRFSNSPDIFEN